MKDSQNLKDALKLIDTPDKWHQYSFEGPGGSYCMSGALRKVAGVEDVTLVSAYAFLTRACNVSYGDVCCWNDDPERTHDEVVAAFKKAIALAEAAES